LDEKAIVLVILHNRENKMASLKAEKWLRYNNEIYSYRQRQKWPETRLARKNLVEK
jgi:hypothetical protein